MEAQDVDNRIKTRSKEQNQKDVTLIDYYRYFNNKFIKRQWENLELEIEILLQQCIFVDINILNPYQKI